jgi:hypothetical protein
MHRNRRHFSTEWCSDPDDLVKRLGDEVVCHQEQAGCALGGLHREMPVKREKSTAYQGAKIFSKKMLTRIEE